MNPVVKALREKLHGEVVIDAQSRDFFSTDGSIFKLIPQIVIYPRNEKDIIEAVRILHFLSEKGKYLPITARGKGTDQSGAALTEGVSLVLPAHMKRLVGIGKDTVTVQPGMIYAHLQGVLHSHNRFLPPYPASMDFSTIGGALANNASGEKTLKYGSTRNYVAGLRVVLSNGDVIETHRLNKKQLTQKKKQGDLEGQIYNKIDELIENNSELIRTTRPKVSKNSAGYDLWDIKRADGSFDLSQLFVGSQGTLGVITEATLYHVPYNTKTTLLVGFFESVKQLEQAVVKIASLVPSAQEVVDRNVLEFVQTHKPDLLENVLPEKIPEVVLLVEFDDHKARVQDKKARQAYKILQEFAYAIKASTNQLEQDHLWKVRRQAAAVVWMHQGPKKALPIIEDGIVPLQHFDEFVNETYKLLNKYGVKVAIWGHAGNAHLHIQPFMDLGNIRDRHKIFTLSNDFYKMVLKYGGSISGEHNDGIMRGPYLRKMFGADLYDLFKEVKKAFDPQNILNPHSKLGATQEYGMVHLRREYSMKHLAEHLPGISSFH